MGKIITQIKQFREAKKMTQQELADLVGIRRETIARLEKNLYNPSLDIALKLAEIFQVPVETLFQRNTEDS
ncbi:helix-turn-helix transcriptional regulator [Streptococcus merionis]|uniref:Cro/CI family transcriptional regulator n=1 Tax=Streptococcus merionis TaxID=400065 RepID=A0A239SXH6_9STRE|nr:helix-turn-helix transcriptional regulator [Streptococcus merionis]SNU90180.1 Cro/CI family transcriptional regulator [Streptococcus merionis]